MSPEPFHEFLPQSELFLIQGARHFVQMDETEQVARLILAMLNQRSKQSGYLLPRLPHPECPATASEAASMCSKPLIATAPSAKTDEQITELHLWAVREGLRRAPAAPLFEEFCRRLVAFGVPLWRAFAGMRTLHPQWAGLTYKIGRAHV